jgi:hypothetical protein
MLKPTKKNRIVHDSDSFEEDEQDKETFCLVCLGPYHTSQENWIQCRDIANNGHLLVALMKILILYALIVSEINFISIIYEYCLILKLNKIKLR